jgi:4-amino-4-deoxy-L-arabinose transferase-like glycosyltransferase
VADHGEPSLNASLKALVVLLALLLPTLLVGLGSRPVYKIQEVRIAETAREMIASGDWGVPHYNGELRLQKPPLPYWLTAASYELGSIDETTTRLPAVIFSLLTALLLFAWAQRETGIKAAANTTLVLTASYIGIRYGRSGEADAILLFFISAACLIGYQVFQHGGNKGLQALFGLALGLGFLSKGPAALAIPLLTLLGYGWMEKRFGTLKQCFSLPGVVLLLVTAFGWYAWLVWRLPDAVHYFVTRQVDETFVSGNHAKPVWWYFAHAFEFFAPWGFLLIPAAWAAFRVHGTPPLPLHVKFAWIWLAIVGALLTATINKQMQYALLFAPPIAIIMGHYLTSARGLFAGVNRGLLYLFTAATAMGVGYILVKAGVSAAPWLLLPVLPLLLHRALCTDISAPVLFVAATTAMAYLYSDEHLSKETRKVAAQSILSAAGNAMPLYQSAPGDGALSFYAHRVIPPVKDDGLQALVQKAGTLWLITHEIVTMPGVAVEVLAETDEFKLCRLQRKQ